MAAVAREHGVPYTTLLRVIKRGGVIAKRGRPTALSAVEEEQLRDLVVRGQQQGVGVTKTTLLAAVSTTQRVTERKGKVDPFKGKAPGKKWRQGFMRRQGLSLRKASPVTKNRRIAARDAAGRTQQAGGCSHRPTSSALTVSSTWMRTEADGRVMPPNFVYAGKQLSHNALGAIHFYPQSSIILKEGTHMMDGRLFPKLLDVMAKQIPGVHFFLQPWDQLFGSVKSQYQKLLGQAAFLAGGEGFNPTPSQIISLVDTAIHYSVGFSMQPLQRAFQKTGLFPPSRDNMLAAAAASMEGGKQQPAFKPWVPLTVDATMLRAAAQRSAQPQPSLRFPAEDRFYFMHEVVAEAAKKAAKASKRPCK
ncbi:hypothetical protein QJQ45_010273 [Haematococcus lacustris]|nr:hypothetical protein QJQ45_010273 [Haematococcus lacustris]